MLELKRTYPNHALVNTHFQVLPAGDALKLALHARLNGSVDLVERNLADHQVTRLIIDQRFKLDNPTAMAAQNTDTIRFC